MGVSRVKNGSSLTSISGREGENASYATESGNGVNKAGDYKKVEGAFNNNVYGSYVHGIFDSEGVAVAVLEALAGRKGVKLDELKSFDYKEYKEKQYDILADMVRQNMDIKRVYEILG